MRTLLDSSTSSSGIFDSRGTVLNDTDSAHIVGVFSHHRDAKVALEELRDAGFPSDWITLMARNCQRYSWLSKVTINNYFDEETFSFNRVASSFFQRLFQRGKYLLLVEGNERDVNYAGSIIGRRRGHSEVWHCE